MNKLNQIEANVKGIIEYDTQNSLYRVLQPRTMKNPSKKIAEPTF